MKNIYQYLFFAGLFPLMIQTSFCQKPDFSKVRNYYPEDSAGITQLISAGVKIYKGKVIAWFPKDSLSTKRMTEIVDTLNIGILAAERFIKAPRHWQVQQQNDLYTFYFRNERFISHASHAGFISIPFWRIKQGKAPWLHEVLHEMLNAKVGNSLPENDREAMEPHLWLFEGLPDYIASQVSQQQQLPQFDPLANAVFGNSDSLCKKELRKDTGIYIASFIGKRGIMPELSGDKRIRYAPAFYHCSCSFVKYLVEQKGIEPLLISISAYPYEDKELDKFVNPSFEVMKTLWMEKLKINK